MSVKFELTKLTPSTFSYRTTFSSLELSDLSLDANMSTLYESFRKEGESQGPSSRTELADDASADRRADESER